MNAIFLTTYLLAWPMVVGIVLAVIVSAFCKEWRGARKDGRSLI